MLSIEDRLGLQDLIAIYSWALDTSDAEGLVACFTEDCVMSEEVFEDPDVWEGHEGIRGLMAHYANAPGFPGRQHHVTQTQYTPQPDGSVTMRSFAFVTEWLELRDIDLRETDAPAAVLHHAVAVAQAHGIGKRALSNFDCFHYAYAKAAGQPLLTLDALLRRTHLETLPPTS